MGIHDQHRQRLKERYLREGAEALSDQQLLELYLFYAIPRRDVSPLASLLLEQFGSLAGVFRAEAGELTAVPGIGTHAALGITLLTELSRRCALSLSADPGSLISDWQDAGDYLLPLFYGAVIEQLYALCLDTKGHILRCVRLDRGGSGFASLDLSELVQLASGLGAAAVILAHNHPSGSLQPSPADIRATLEAKRALAAARITLHDHLIIADEGYNSLRRCIPTELWER